MFPKPSKEKIQEALDKARCKSSSSASVQASSPLDHNPIYEDKRRVSERFKLRPFLCSDIDGYVAPDKRNPNLEKCSITRNGSKTEPEMKRNHGFKEDPTIMHVKGEIATCPITKGNGKRGVTQPNVSHEAKLPDATLNQVTVKERIAKIENGSRSW